MIDDNQTKESYGSLTFEEGAVSLTLNLTRKDARHLLNTLQFWADTYHPLTTTNERMRKTVRSLLICSINQS